MHAKYLYIENSGRKSGFLELFREAEALLGKQSGYYTMSRMAELFRLI